MKNRLPHFKQAHINTFPAVHMRRMDAVDFIWKFSSELLVFGLVAIVALLNLVFFTGKDAAEYTDQSLSAKLLSYHPEQNPKLAAKNATIKTTVVHENGFIQTAQADNFQALQSQVVFPGDLSEDGLMVSDNGLVKPNPDSVSSLITKQIKIYETKQGDTLTSIAQTYGISVQTIMWANKLTSQDIKPGWFLILLPTNGVLHKATSNDTLPDIAKKYNAKLETIIAYNGLASAEDIDGDQLVIVPGGTIPQPKPKNTNTPVIGTDGKVKPQGVTTPAVVDNGSGHIFPWGYCTWYVATRVHVPWGGNAKNWLANAKAYGAIVNNEAAAGTIVVTTDDARFGHVAYVEKIEDGKIFISEMNYEKFGKVSQRWLSTSSKTIRGYIHP